MHISIDLETLGTNTDSEIISIGAVAFDMQGKIIDDFLVDIQMSETSHLNMTIGTLQFWLQQQPEAWPKCFTNNDECVQLPEALRQLKEWIDQYPIEQVWANGTKFDLGMLEHQFKRFSITVPWAHNADGCMRTLRLLANAKSFHQVAVDYANNQDCGVAHNALADAKWQAHYIAFAYNKLV